MRMRFFHFLSLAFFLSVIFPSMPLMAQSADAKSIAGTIVKLIASDSSDDLSKAYALLKKENRSLFKDKQLAGELALKLAKRAQTFKSHLVWVDANEVQAYVKQGRYRQPEAEELKGVPEVQGKSPVMYVREYDAGRMLAYAYLGQRTLKPKDKELVAAIKALCKTIAPEESILQRIVSAYELSQRLGVHQQEEIQALAASWINGEGFANPELLKSLTSDSARQMTPKLMDASIAYFLKHPLKDERQKRFFYSLIERREARAKAAILAAFEPSTHPSRLHLIEMPYRMIALEKLHKQMSGWVQERTPQSEKKITGQLRQCAAVLWKEMLDQEAVTFELLAPLAFEWLGNDCFKMQATEEEIQAFRSRKWQFNANVKIALDREKYALKLCQSLALLDKASGAHPDEATAKAFLAFIKPEYRQLRQWVIKHAVQLGIQPSQLEAASQKWKSGRLDYALVASLVKQGGKADAMKMVWRHYKKTPLSKWSHSDRNYLRRFEPSPDMATEVIVFAAEQIDHAALPESLRSDRSRSSKKNELWGTAYWLVFELIKKPELYSGHVSDETIRNLNAKQLKEKDMNKRLCYLWLLLVSARDQDRAGLLREAVSLYMQAYVKQITKLYMLNDGAPYWALNDLSLFTLLNLSLDDELDKDLEMAMKMLLMRMYHRKLKKQVHLSLLMHRYADALRPLQPIRYPPFERWELNKPLSFTTVMNLHRGSQLKTEVPEGHLEKRGYLKPDQREVVKKGIFFNCLELWPDSQFVKENLAAYFNEKDVYYLIRSLWRISHAESRVKSRADLKAYLTSLKISEHRKDHQWMHACLLHRFYKDPKAKAIALSLYEANKKNSNYRLGPGLMLLMEIEANPARLKEQMALIRKRSYYDEADFYNWVLQVHAGQSPGPFKPTSLAHAVKTKDFKWLVYAMVNNPRFASQLDAFARTSVLIYCSELGYKREGTFSANWSAFIGAFERLRKRE